MATSNLERQREELVDARAAAAPRYPKRRRKAVSSQPKAAKAKAARQPRRWSPKGWSPALSPALCRRSFPAGLETQHEPATNPRPPPGSKLAWLRSNGTKSIWEQMALADRDAAQASQAGSAGVAAAAAPRPKPAPQPVDKPLAVGDAVQVQFKGKRGGIYAARVAKVHNGGESVTLDWANGEQTQRRQPAANVQRRKPAKPKVKVQKRQPAVAPAAPAAVQPAAPPRPRPVVQPRPAMQPQPAARLPPQTQPPPQPQPQTCVPLGLPSAAASAPPPPPAPCEVIDLAAAEEKPPMKTPPAMTETASRVSILSLTS